MKKVLGVGLLCAVLLPVLGCTITSTVPFVYTNNESVKFQILGEVKYESSNLVGYAELLKAARALYPDCDYVIDIMIDQRKVEKFLFFFKMGEVVTNTMRGTAIKYIR
jgi:hypothetical protein